VPAHGNLMIKKGRKYMFGTGIMDGLSSLTIILMAVAGAGYALYISGESLAKKAAKADKSPRLANLLKMIGGPLMLIAIGLFLLRWVINRF
jgi:type IV secretory pathway TrbD component